jgi:hypothetical protein
MAAVMVTRTPEGYTVARTFRSQAAAQRALTLLLEIPEVAFEPAPAPEPAVVKHSLATEIMRDLGEADDPPPHDGRLFWKPSDDAE